MAVLHNPLISSEARGKVGGLVYNTWRGRAYAKSKTGPAQPRSERQLNIRAMSTKLIRAWQSIGATLITLWNDYAAAHPDIDWSGNAKRLSGANWYLRCNLRLSDMAKSLIDTPPAVPAPPAVTALVLTPGTGSISCAFDVSGGTSISLDIWDQGPHSPGVQPKIQRAKHKAYAPGETSPYVLSGLAPGLHTLFARHVSETTGLASPWVMASATVT